MLNRVVPATFQQIEEGNDIVLQIKFRMFNAAPHSGLCGKMADDFRFFLIKYLSQKIHITHVKFVKPQRRISGTDNGFLWFQNIRDYAQFCKPCKFESHIIIVVDTIDHNQLVRRLREVFCNMKADETSTAGK